MRKVNLQTFNYFCTFTYDSAKHTEESFMRKLKGCFKMMCHRRNWKYVGVWERSPEKKRLHFHGLFYIPDGAMVGELIEVHDYSPIKKKVQHTIQNTYFNERFGQIEGDKVFTEFVNCILPSDNDYNIITHIDGADIFFSAFRFKNLESFDKIDALNKQFSKMINEKYPGAHKALKAKKTVKNPTESFCIVYDKDKHENSRC